MAISLRSGSDDGSVGLVEGGCVCVCVCVCVHIFLTHTSLHTHVRWREGVGGG